MSTAVASLTRLTLRIADRVNNLLPLRVWNRLSQVRGSVLVKGIAYSAFFSLFPILALAFTAFSLVLRSRPDLQDRLIEDVTSYLSTTLPGVLKESPDSSTGLVYAPNLVSFVTSENLLTITGVVVVVTLVWGALGWVSSLRLGIRAAMHLPVSDFHPAWAKARDFAIALLLGGAVVVSAVVSVGIVSATETVLGLVGLPTGIGTRVLVQTVAFVVVAALDTLLFYLQFRLLAAARLPRVHLLRGALAAAIAFGVLKVVAGVLLPQFISGNILLASFSVLALLVWQSWVARITLLAAAWSGLMAEETERTADELSALSEQIRRDAADLKGAGLGSDTPNGRRPEARPDGVSGRAEDRVVLAAGMVLGATAAVGVRALASAVTTAGRVISSGPERDDD